MIRMYKMVTDGLKHKDFEDGEKIPKGWHDNPYNLTPRKTRTKKVDADGDQS